MLRDRGPALRITVSVLAIVFTLTAAAAEAAAQTYPPLMPGDYYAAPPPPYYPPPPPRAYANPPIPPANVGAPGDPYYGQRSAYAYRDANGMPVQPFGPGYGEQIYDDQPSPYPPPGRPYFGSPDRPNFGGPAGAQQAPGDSATIAALPPDDRPESGPPRETPPQLRRQLVDYVTPEPAGTVIIDTPHTYLYLVLGNGKAMRYGIGVGREGYTWSGTERISRMTEWPDWHPPKEMIERQPYLPRFMAGGNGNPLGARALYLGNTLYRIHGTNQPSTIGHFVSSGCIRLTNEDIEDLYNRVNLGSRIVVLPGSPPASVAARRVPYAR
jgi:lipoprotein-anchoring transpeptidase ErfK/SrfK